MCRSGLRLVVVAGLVLAGGRSGLRAQSVIDGHVSALIDHLPAREDTEGRLRLFAERRVEVGRHVRITLAGYAEGLLADRARRTRDAIVRPHDLSVELSYDRFDLRAGMTRVVWGRLDELQPSDVVNPLDVSRFLFEGRSEARRPVWLARARVFLTPGLNVEGVVVPVFRRGRFDELEEPTSPFNLQRDLQTEVSVCLALDICPPLRFSREEPRTALRNLQGGVRVNATSGRVDWSLAAYRGFEPFGLVAPVSLVGFVERFPRFTMVAGDFETVRGPWGVRGELAAFVDDHFPVGSGVGILRGHSTEGGLGVDRKTGEYRLGSGLLLRRERATRSVGTVLSVGPGGAGVFSNGGGPGGSVGLANTDVTLLAFADRRFARETRWVRAFAAYNASDAHAFVRAIGAISPRDNLWLEGAVGWFFGEGTDLIGRFGDRDFIYTRLKVYF